jgi:hypothetical protein
MTRLDRSTSVLSWPGSTSTCLLSWPGSTGSLLVVMARLDQAIQHRAGGPDRRVAHAGHRVILVVPNVSLTAPGNSRGYYR